MTQTSITLNWRLPLHSKLSQYSTTLSWIYQVVWADMEDATIPAAAGVYVIENNDNKVVYTGKAEGGLANRFGMRTEALREYLLSTDTSNPVANYTLYVATVEPTTEIGKAEKWLIRVLRAADDAGDEHFLQNIQDVNKPLEVNEGDTLSIIHNGSAPPFFDDPPYTYTGPTKI
jgi:hypothetical protein